MQQSWRDQEEWLETDGLGGFASGTVGGIRARRYHGLLTVAITPPTGRFVLVNGVEVVAHTPAGSFALSSQRYAGQVINPEGFRYIESFDTEPWPTWRFRLPDGTRVEQEIFVKHGQPLVCISWRLVGDAPEVKLSVRPLLSGRDYHELHHENGGFQSAAEQRGQSVRWQPYPGASQIPAVVAHCNGNYRHEPLWYRHFQYQEEWLRGFESTEDLASPGSFEFDVSSEEAALIFAAESREPQRPPPSKAIDYLRQLRQAESSRRNSFASPLHRAADQYIVKRGDGKSIIAGYPWFADWGRDTFISLRGLCIATGRLDEAGQILTSWSRHVSQGMLPNRFPDQGAEPEYNSVDASLWYVICVFEYLEICQKNGRHVTASSRDALLGAVKAILAGYAQGTRHGIRLDDDGLLLSGEKGVQLTWMDAKIGDHVVTPRWGKPVEVQALWLNCLARACEIWPQWEKIGERGAANFRGRFWNEAEGCLFDVIDCSGVRGQNDPSFRPNQILAVGGLPLMLLEQSQARQVVDAVESKLLTPLGLRSLALGAAGYCPRYSGGPAQRDGAYHQGTVWPWLMGPFVEAWVRVRDGGALPVREARQRFMEPLLKHLNEAGLGHISEIADADAPHMPRGCPFQAWSLAELLRLEQIVLAEKQVNREAAQMHQRIVIQ